MPTPKKTQVASKAISPTVYQHKNATAQVEVGTSNKKTQLESRFSMIEYWLQVTGDTLDLLENKLAPVLNADLSESHKDEVKTGNGNDAPLIKRLDEYLEIMAARDEHLKDVIARLAI